MKCDVPEEGCENAVAAGRSSGCGTITVIYRAKVKLGAKEVDLGDFECEEEAEQAIAIAEAHWLLDIEDAKNPSHTRKCFNCNGSGRTKGDECNTCAGIGRVPH